MLTGLLAYLFLCTVCFGIIAVAIHRAPLIEDDWMLDLSDEQLDKLCTIRLRALSRMERIEAINAEAELDCNEACDILSVTDTDSASRGYCDDLAFHAAHVGPTLGKIAKARAVR